MTQRAADPSGASEDALPWQTYICNACGLIYDEEEGDVDGGLAPGTRFADIPEDWACPLCGVRKDDFVPYQQIAAGSGNAATGFPESRVADIVPDTFHPTRSGGRTRMLGKVDGVVIVGAGRAGWEVAQAVRRRDPEIPITLVTGCAGDRYDKPLLSIAHAKAIPPQAMVRERGLDAARRLQVHLLSDTFASGLSPESHQLRTTRGSLYYRKLVLAQGARPRQFDALPAASCWRINDLDTYRHLRERLATDGNQGRDIIVVGAGLVGCELTNDLAIAGHRITLVDVSATPLSSLLPPPAAAALLHAWKDLPIRFVGKVEVAGVATDGVRRILHANDGRIFTADHIISATGLEVDRALADSAGLAWQDGIAVDASTMATSAPDVFALGDCITIDGTASRYIEPILRQAQAIAGMITGIDPVPYVQRPSPLRIKTSSCNLQLDGMPAAHGSWRIDTEHAPTASGTQLCMSQWTGNTLQARLTVGN